MYQLVSYEAKMMIFDALNIWRIRVKVLRVPLGSFPKFYTSINDTFNPWEWELFFIDIIDLRSTIRAKSEKILG